MEVIVKVKDLLLLCAIIFVTQTVSGSWRNAFTKTYARAKTCARLSLSGLQQATKRIGHLRRNLTQHGQRFVQTNKQQIKYALAGTVFPTVKTIQENHAITDTMPIASYWDYLTENPQIQDTARRTKMVQCYSDDCAKNAKKNNDIKSHKLNSETVRIATYNVHMWHNAQHKKTFDEIVTVIKSMNPDILVLQEVVGVDGNMSPIYTLFKSMGYDFACDRMTRQDDDECFGSVVFSKYPLVQSAQGKANHIKTKIQLPNDKSITLFGVHLDHKDEETRKKEVEEIMQAIGASEKNCVIAGDFNALRLRDYKYTLKQTTGLDLLQQNYFKHRKTHLKSTALETLEKQGFLDSFTKGKQHSPHFTAWSGTAIDYLYVSPEWNLPIRSSYVYYSSASDHLPIIMDVTVN